MKEENKTQMGIEEFSEELFDKYGYYIDDNLSGMEMVAGRNVVLQNDFMSACKELKDWQSQNTYTQEQMIAFGEAVKRECLNEVTATQVKLGQPCQVNEQSILSINISKLLNK